MLLNIRKFFDFRGLERQRRDGLKKKKTTSGVLEHDLRTPTPLVKELRAHLCWATDACRKRKVNV